MAVIRTTADIPEPAAHVWSKLAAPGEAHVAFAPVLAASHMADPETRVATFANGLIVTERLFSVDHDLRRVAYGLIGTDLAHHSAAMEVVPLTYTSCRFEWTCDVFPHDAVARIRPLMEAGTQAFVVNCAATRRG